MDDEFQSISDEELARRTQSGCLTSFEELVYRYERRIYRFVANFCSSTVDRAEITQETFVRAFKSIGRFDSQRDFAPWLFMIARRKCIDRFRAVQAADGEPGPEEHDMLDPAESLARREEQRGLWEFARRILPDAQYQALWLRYVEDMNIEQIAKALGSGQARVRVLLFRARGTLAHRLKTNRDEGFSSVVPSVSKLKSAFL